LTYKKIGKPLEVVLYFINLSVYFILKTQYLSVVLIIIDNQHYKILFFYQECSSFLSQFNQIYFSKIAKSNKQHFSFFSSILNIFPRLIYIPESLIVTYLQYERQIFRSRQLRAIQVNESGVSLECRIWFYYLENVKSVTFFYSKF
jgi:hypothetical protein